MYKALAASQVSREKLVRLALQATPAPLGLLVVSDLLDRKAFRALRVFLVQLGLTDRLVLLALKVILAQPDQRAYKEHRVVLDRLVPKVYKATPA